VTLGKLREAIYSFVCQARLKYQERHHRFRSLQIVDGFPAISYYDNDSGELRFAVNDIADGSGTWTDVLVDANGDGTATAVGFYSSLQIVDSLPAIGYHDATNGELRFARADDAAGSSWTCTRTDVTGNALDIDSGDPAALGNGSDFGNLLAQLETDTNTFRITNPGSSIAICDISFDGAGATTDAVSGDFTLSYSGSAPTTASPALLHPTMMLDFFVTFAPQDADDNSAVSVSIAFDDTMDCSSVDGTFALNLDGNGLLDFGDSRSDIYGETNFSELGARHVLSGVKLGSRRDGEADATQTAVTTTATMTTPSLTTRMGLFFLLPRS
jgi:hypothetical protein